VLTCRRLPPASLPEGTSHDSLGDTVSATVLHMSEVRELWEVLHGA